MYKINFQLHGNQWVRNQQDETNDEENETGRTRKRERFEKGGEDSSGFSDSTIVRKSRYYGSVHPEKNPVVVTNRQTKAED